jgi:hypothetical protein
VTRCLDKAATARFANGGAIVDALETLSTPLSPARQSTAARPGIAVLPFDDLSPDHDNGYFVDGLADEVSSDLSKISALRVISRTSVQQTDPAQLQDVQAIARAASNLGPPCRAASICTFRRSWQSAASRKPETLSPTCWQLRRRTT